MSNNLNGLLQRVAKADAALAAELRSEVEYLAKRREFGLNFEKHRPETVQLHGRPVRVGDKVRFLAPRGSDEAVPADVWLVRAVQGTSLADATASLLLLEGGDETTERALVDLVAVADFRDPIYPGLTSTGKVERGGDKPFHVVVNSENYHALEALLFTCRNKVDVIYIDPPYNTGAKDWKYNNDYVDSEDSFRHSKWLSFMERRLKLAKKLLNPVDSVLIVTIDEKEYLRLGLLLEQTFQDARITMVTSSINGAGSTRTGTFNRSAEYIYFVQIGTSSPRPLVLPDEWNPVATKNKSSIRWNLLMRSGTQPFRTTHPNLFYPVYVRNTPDGPVFHSVGEPFYGDGWRDHQAPEGAFAVWPIRKDGQEGRWQISAPALRALVATGFARIGGWKEEASTIYYLKAGEKKKVLDGTFQTTGHRSDGSVITDGADYEAQFVPTDIWRITAHDAGNSGSRLLGALIPGRKFPFPKSLYAVEDALRFFITDKPDALVVDFFAGSGTTAHAVARLNRQDDGRRRSFIVTNNEVSLEEQALLRSQGHRPGDPEWEALGICSYITKPRISAAVTGVRADEQPVDGEYKYVDEFPMSEGFEENVEFFDLTYQDAQLVELDMAFSAIAPLLWLRAGGTGRRIDEPSDTYDVADSYAVLFQVDAAREFAAACATAPSLRLAYIVTDDERQFQMITGTLPDGVEPVRLYESYLRTFEINTGKE